tara:strand:+ start:66 stop:452 length:387 start_codon:yes stop_codon:yes gene_type:complete
MNKKIYIVIIVLFGFLLKSCDPTYPVSISNQTDSEVTIQAKKTLRFWNDSIKLKELSDENWIEFNLKPKQSIECGMTIGGLRNDLPFSELKILKPQDTIIAKNENQVMELFDKSFFGNLNTPYKLTIK